MSKLYYCPKCGKLEIANIPLYQNELTIVNMRDGYGMPIHHYRCECGNYLAGYMNLREGSEDEVGYYKSLIKDYNPGGSYYEKNTNLMSDFPVDLLKAAEEAYKKRRNKIR